MAAPKNNKRSACKEGKTDHHNYSPFKFSNGAKKSHDRPTDDSPAEPVRGRKRPSVDDPLDMGENSKGTGVTSMLDSFGADINKAFNTKRKRLEMFTKSSIKSSHQAIEQMWKTQQSERMNLTENYCTQFNAAFLQWDNDVQKSKDQNEKLANLFRQMQKMFQKRMSSQAERLKSVKQLLDQYMQSLEELQKSHSEHQTALQTELREEMSLLQKKILMDIQQQDIVTMRKSLQTMLL